MRWNDVPLLVTATAAAFLFGAALAVVVVACARSERVRAWLAGFLGGTQLLCPRCGRRTIMLHFRGSWLRMPRWLENAETGARVCSTSCAAAMGNQRIDLPRLRKAAEVVDVVRWVGGVLPKGDGLWIGPTLRQSDQAADETEFSE